LCGGTSINDLYRSFKIDIPKSPLWGYWGFLGLYIEAIIARNAGFLRAYGNS
jgi:hypothetical protein